MRCWISFSYLCYCDCDKTANFWFKSLQNSTLWLMCANHHKYCLSLLSLSSLNMGLGVSQLSTTSLRHVERQFSPWHSPPGNTPPNNMHSGLRHPFPRWYRGERPAGKRLREWTVTVTSSQEDRGGRSVYLHISPNVINMWWIKWINYQSNNHMNKLC